MMDHTVPWIGLTMQRTDMNDLPDFPLPSAYGWRFYRPGDIDLWADIEISAGEFETREQAHAGFRKYFPTDDQLDARMFFLTDHGVPFATAAAWYGEDGHDASEGRLHWVGIDAAHQGQRLSYPLVALAMRRMVELGHRSAYLTTQTASWPAIKVYRAFGFVPLIGDEKAIEGWRIVSEKTGVGFLKEH